jgi:choline dehydrogenase
MTNSVPDYIIVGAGSAGCALANRLTEDSTVKVLLLEAGGPDKMQKIQIPAAFQKLFKTECDWAYETEELEHMNRRRMYWPRGRVLGGSSSINAMVYSRANRSDHDRFSEFGVEGWGYDDILPYYKKSENNERGPSEFHGVGGELNVADLRCVNPLTHRFIEAAQGAGLKYNKDFNGASQEGVGYPQVTQKDGKRHSAAAAFLKPALSRPNLTVKTGAHVMRLLFDKNKVVGVEFIQDGKTEQTRVNLEVILSGGAINSPQTLMLSGLGPADHLRAMDIPVVADLPGVGQNLMDHLLIGVEYECREPIGLHRADNVKNILNYFLFKKGPLTSNVAEAVAFLKTDQARTAPNIELVFAPVFYMDNGFGNPDLHGFSRSHQSEIKRPVRRAGDSTQLSGLGGRYGRLRRGRQTRARDFRLETFQPVSRQRVVAGRGREDRRRLRRTHPPDRRDDLSPGRDVQDGK